MAVCDVRDCSFPAKYAERIFVRGNGLIFDHLCEGHHEQVVDMLKEMFEHIKDTCEENGYFVQQLKA